MDIELHYFPLLSRRMPVSEHSRVDLTQINLIYTVARSAALPINYPGDPSGVPGLACGISFVPVDTLKWALNVSWQQLKRQLELGVRFRFWRRYTVGNGYVRFSLRSPRKVAEGLGLPEPGSRANINWKDFDIIHVLTTEIVAIAWQQRTRYKAIQEATKGQAVPRPSQLVFTTATQRRQVPGKPSRLNGRYLAINEEEISPFGVSLERVAELTGKSYSTVACHLNNKWRRENGIYKLPKMQLAVETDLLPGEVELNQSEGQLIDELPPERYFIDGDTVYRKSNMVYYDRAGWNCRTSRHINGRRQETGQQFAATGEAITEKLTPEDSATVTKRKISGKDYRTMVEERTVEALALINQWVRQVEAIVDGMPKPTRKGRIVEEVADELDLIQKWQESTWSETICQTVEVGNDVLSPSDLEAQFKSHTRDGNTAKAEAEAWSRAVGKIVGKAKFEADAKTAQAKEGDVSKDEAERARTLHKALAVLKQPSVDAPQVKPRKVCEQIRAKETAQGAPRAQTIGSKYQQISAEALYHKLDWNYFNHNGKLVQPNKLSPEQPGPYPYIHITDFAKAVNHDYADSDS